MINTYDLLNEIRKMYSFLDRSPERTRTAPFPIKV